MKQDFYLPAEWEEQSGVQLTWPHAATDWKHMLKEVQSCFAEIAKEISRREKLLIVAPNIESVKKQIQSKVNIENICFFECDTNDTWARDHGGISILDKNGNASITDFKFNGWGMKFAAHKDNLITGKAFRSGLFNAQYINCLNFVIEGGSIESDGKGTLLTTSECLLSPNRNGGWDKEQIEEYLRLWECLESYGWIMVFWRETIPTVISTHWQDFVPMTQSFMCNATTRKTAIMNL